MEHKRKAWRSRKNLFMTFSVYSYLRTKFSSSDESEACWGDEGNIDFSLSGLILHIIRFSHFRILRVSRWMEHMEVERVYDLIRMDLSRNMRDSSQSECNWDYWKKKWSERNVQNIRREKWVVQKQRRRLSRHILSGSNRRWWKTLNAELVEGKLTHFTIAYIYSLFGFFLSLFSFLLSIENGDIIYRDQ